MKRIWGLTALFLVLLVIFWPCGDRAKLEGNIRRLHSDNVLNVRNGLINLSAMGPRAVQAVPPITALLTNHPTPTIRVGAARSLAAIGSAQALPALILAAEGDPLHTVRMAATSALVAIGKGESEVITVLIRLLKDPHPSPRMVAIWHLSSLGEVALPHLTTALESGNPDLRLGAARALAQMERISLEAVQSLRSLGDEDVWVRVYALVSLATDEMNEARPLSETEPGVF